VLNERLPTKSFVICFPYSDLSYHPAIKNSGANLALRKASKH
jgi:hypothetical protein